MRRILCVVIMLVGMAGLCWAEELEIPAHAIRVATVADSKEQSRDAVIRAALTNSVPLESRALWVDLETTDCLIIMDSRSLERTHDKAMYLSPGWPSVWQWQFVKEVSLYRVTDTGQVAEMPDVDGLRFYYELPELTEADESLVVWVKKMYGVLCFPKFTLEDRTDIEKTKQIKMLEQGLYYGFFLGIILWTGFGYYTFRDRTFLWYIFQVLAGMTVMMTDSPLSCLRQMPRILIVHHYQIAIVTLYACATVFMKYYLDTAKYFPRIDKYLRGLVGVLLCYLAAYAFMPMRLRMDLIYLLDVLCFTSLFAAYYAWWKGHVAGKYFAIATSLYVFFYIYYMVVEIFGLAPFMPLNRMLVIGSLCEGVIFPIALVARVNRIVADKRKVDGENVQLQTEQMRATMLAREAELRMLRFQMNPHFLFNALNSLIAEIPDDPKLALRIAMRLSAYLRYTLTSREQVSLEEELEAVQQYLELEHIRFEEQLQLEIVQPDKLPDMLVPMFCVQPLVENAIKYGMQTSPSPLQLRIGVQSLSDGVSIEVANTGAWCEKKETTTGVGLTNVQERLRIYYPDAHEFSTEEDDGWVRVKMIIRSTR